MKSYSATSQCTCASNAVMTTLKLVFLLLSASSTNACSAYCPPTTFENNIAQAEVIAVAYLWKDISAPVADPTFPWQTSYYQGYASSVHKGNEKIGNGEIIVRSVGDCDSFPVHEHVVVFGDIVYETVAGFATPMPVLQPNACTVSGLWSRLPADQQNLLMDLEEDSTPVGSNLLGPASPAPRPQDPSTPPPISIATLPPIVIEDIPEATSFDLSSASWGRAAFGFQPLVILGLISLQVLFTYGG